MATTITINLKNDSSTSQDFCFFQQPAQYSSSGPVYVSSLCGQPLLPYATSGAVISFMFTPKSYAGVQQQIAPPKPGQPVGQAGALRAIELTPAQGAPINNTTTMSVSPSLGLSMPTSTDDVPVGAFRIVTAVFDPTLTNYNAGVAMESLAGGILLSNFVTALPNARLDCTPSLKFYVQTGKYVAGTVLSFASLSPTAALCDAAAGYTAFGVSYNTDGTWTVKNMVAGLLKDGKPGLIVKSEFTTS